MTDQEQRSRIDELEQAIQIAQLWFRNNALWLDGLSSTFQSVRDVLTRALAPPSTDPDVERKWYQPGPDCDYVDHRYYGEKRCEGCVEALFTEVEG